MNYKEACKNLELNSLEEFDTDLLKKKYRIFALKHHPDKNKEENAVQKFQEIQESYEYLLKYKNFELNENSSDEEDDTDSEDFSNKTNYKSILFSFLRNIIATDAKTKIFYILKNISSTCETNALDVLSKLDKHMLIKLYEIVEKYCDVLHFSEDFLEKMKDIINEKIKNDECIILNPTLEDLFENNLYKLKVNGFTYVVPLWHNELIYDSSGNDVYVKCHPILPENIEIDDKNNIYVKKEYNLQDIWKEEFLIITLGKERFYIKREELILKEKQNVVFAKQGISRINTKNMYDVTSKGDVIVIVKLH
jgi:hypothetical protein